MQHAVTAQVSFDDTVQQTVLFNHTQLNWLTNNIEAVSWLLNAIEAQGIALTHNAPHDVFYDVPANSIIEFFARYKFHENNRALQSNTLIGYINDQRSYGLLEQWNVVVRGLTTNQADTRNIIRLGHHSFPLLRRARRHYDLPHAHIGVLMSKGDIGADLRNTDRQVVQRFRSQAIKDLRYREFPNKGVLVIYPIDKDSQPTNQDTEKVPLDAVEHVIGLGFVFPPVKEYSRGAQEYVTVNLEQLDNEVFEVERDEEEAEEA